MVRFNETSYTIEVETGICPNDDLAMTIDDIISVLQATSGDMRGNDTYYYLLELLRAMMPSVEQLKKLIA